VLDTSKARAHPKGENTIRLELLKRLPFPSEELCQIPSSGGYSAEYHSHPESSNPKSLGLLNSVHVYIPTKNNPLGDVYIPTNNNPLWDVYIPTDMGG
jgi:hypothetical protein